MALQPLRLNPLKSRLSVSSHHHPTPTPPLKPESSRPHEGLSLTVHSIPNVNPAAPWAKLKLIALFLIAASPVIASYFTYYVIRPDGRRNYGTLIDPQKPLPEWMVTPIKGSLNLNPNPNPNHPNFIPLTQLRHQWLLISVSEEGICQKACEERLYLQRQLRESLGKDKDRLDWIWIRTDPTPPTPHP